MPRYERDQPPTDPERERRVDCENKISEVRAKIREFVDSQKEILDAEDEIDQIARGRFYREEDVDNIQDIELTPEERAKIVELQAVIKSGTEPIRSLIEEEKKYLAEYKNLTGGNYDDVLLR